MNFLIGRRILPAAILLVLSVNSTQSSFEMCPQIWLLVDSQQSKAPQLQTAPETYTHSSSIHQCSVYFARVYKAVIGSDI